MTKFRGPFRMPTVFSEVMTGRDKNTFVLAFSPGSAGNTEKLRVARKWVSDVIDIWTSRVDIPRALGFQVACTGSVDVVRRHFARRKEKLLLEQVDARQIKDDKVKNAKLEQLGKDIAACDTVTHLDGQGITDWLRRFWVDALSLHHPSMQYHDISGKEHRKIDAAAEKVGKPRGSKKPIVVERKTITRPEVVA